MMNYLYTCMSGGSTNGVTPILVGFSLINHPAIGVPPLMETPMYKWPALATTNPLRYLGVIFPHGDRPWISQPQAVPAPAETKPKKTIVETATVRFEKRPFGMAPAKED